MSSIFLVVFCFATVLCSATEESKSDEAGKLVDELFQAIRDDNASQVQSLIDRGVQINSGISIDGGKPFTYPLHDAIGLHRSDADDFGLENLKLIIKNGADLETVDFIDRTPLYKAVEYDNAKAVKILLENGANPNNYNAKFNSSVLDAAILSSGIAPSRGEEIIDLLIEHGANVNETDEYGQSYLHRVIFGRHKKAIELLIEKGANVNAVEKRWKMTPLLYIAIVDSTPHNAWTEDDSLKFAELLVNHGADVYAKARHEHKEGTALDLATSEKLRKFLGSKMGIVGWLKTIW